MESKAPATEDLKIGDSVVIRPNGSKETERYAKSLGIGKVVRISGDRVSVQWGSGRPRPHKPGRLLKYPPVLCEGTGAKPALPAGGPHTVGAFSGSRRSKELELSIKPPDPAGFVGKVKVKSGDEPTDGPTTKYDPTLNKLPASVRSLTVGDLMTQLFVMHLPESLEVIVRTEWEGDVPNGNCFQISSLSLGDDHGTGKPFLALECNQEFPLIECAAGKDGDCLADRCPQLLDGEPERSGRHCPLDHPDEDY